jgi:HK97 family phage portal protein
MANAFTRFIQGQVEGKAIPNSAAFRGDVPATIYSPGERYREGSKVTQREAKRHGEAYGGAEAMDWVMDACDFYAQTVSQADWQFKRGGKIVSPRRDENTPKRAPVAPQDLVRLLERPNPAMLYDELIELLVIDLLLVGNGYWLKYRQTDEGKPLALYRLAPPYINIVPDAAGNIRHYEYQPTGARNPLRYRPEEIIHFKRPNPHSAFYGLGLIKGGGRPFDLELAVTESQASYYENRADPSLIFQSERRVPRDVFRRLNQQLRARVSGPSKQGEALLLESGLKATPLSPTAAQAMFAEIGDKSRDRILAMFRLNAKLLGLPTNDGESLSNIRREFDTKTMRPFINKLAVRISEGLTKPAWDHDFHIPYEYIMPQEELVRLAGDFATTPGVKVREVRRFLMPTGVLDGLSTGDEEIDDMVLNLPGEEADEDGQPVAGEERFADQPIGSEPGRPPKPENTRAFPRAGGTPPRGAKVGRIPKAGKALSVDEVAQRLEALQPEGKASPKLRGEQRPPDPAEAVRDAELDAINNQAAFEIRNAVAELERALLDHVEGKAFEPKGLIGRVRKSEAWKVFRARLTAIIETAAQQSVATAFRHQGSTEDADLEGIARGVVNRPEGVRAITDNLRKQIGDKVAEGVREGADREAIDGAIRGVIDTWRESKAETVAMTEGVEAYNEGTLNAIQTLPGYDHERVMVTDGRDHDEPCVEADGQVWTIEHARANRLEHPRCRRAFVPIPL